MKIQMKCSWTWDQGSPFHAENNSIRVWFRRCILIEPCRTGRVSGGRWRHWGGKMQDGWGGRGCEAWPTCDMSNGKYWGYYRKWRQKKEGYWYGCWLFTVYSVGSGKSVKVKFKLLTNTVLREIAGNRCTEDWLMHGKMERNILYQEATKVGKRLPLPRNQIFQLRSSWRDGPEEN